MEHFSEELPGVWYGDTEYRNYIIEKKCGRYVIFIRGAYVDWAASLQIAVDWCIYDSKISR